MNKKIVALMVVASAVLSSQVMAANTAEVTILGEVNDSATSCEVTPVGALNSGIVRLITTTTEEVTGKAANTLFKKVEFGYEVANCAKGSANAANVNGLTVSVSGSSSANATILDNSADDGATGVGIGIEKKSDFSRISFDSTPMTEKYVPGEITKLAYNAGYVKLNDATTVTEGPVKGVATFTIDYTTK